MTKTFVKAKENKVANGKWYIRKDILKRKPLNVEIFTLSQTR